MSEIKKFALYSFVCAIFFAAVEFTPLSGVVSSTLASRFKSAFGYESENAGLRKTLIGLPGLSGLNGFHGAYTVFAVADIAGITETPDIFNRAVNADTHFFNFFNNEPIMSIRELYEHYRNYGTVRIEEAVCDNADIPAGKYRITPRNFSVQHDITNPRLLMNNETSYNVNIEDFLDRPFPIAPFDISRQDEPVVLIIHTHATESFVDAGTFYYSPPFTAERTTDINRNVVLIGIELKETLRAHNIPAVQSRRIHDYPSFRDSYRRSLETVNEYLERYPSVRYIIDVHRDSIIAHNGEKFRPVININGLDTAQVMIVAGTDNGGAYHPRWRDNLTFSAHLQQKMNSRYPMLARPINLRAQRFNQHSAAGAIILEIGSCGSSFDEALRAARLVGECLAELILENNR